MLGRQIDWPHPPTEMFRIFTPTPLCPAALVSPLSVCGSNNCCRFIRLHINVVSEPIPALLVALQVCLPVAGVTVEVERTRWLKSPQQAYCCPCSHFNINGSVYLVQAVIKILWMSWITICVFLAKLCSQKKCLIRINRVKIFEWLKIKATLFAHTRVSRTGLWKTNNKRRVLFLEEFPGSRAN